MRIVTLLAVWTVGSLVVGLVLGRVFSLFAARRHAEETLFTWAEQLRIGAAFRGKKVRISDPDPIALGLPDSDSAAPVATAGWLSRWTVRHHGRIQ